MTQVTTPVAAEKHNRNPLEPFHDDIVKMVVAPYIVDVIKQNPNATPDDIHKKFRESTGSSVSLKTFCEWMKTAGIGQKTAWSGITA